MTNADMVFVGGRIFTGHGRPAEPGAVGRTIKRFVDEQAPAHLDVA